MSEKTNHRDEVLSKIEQIDDLPTLPGIAQKALELSQDPNVSFSDLSKLIHADPPLTAKILRLANSAMYSRREPAKTLDQAIFTIGLNEVVAVCSSVGVLRAFQHWRQIHLERNLMWKHSMATAFLARSFEHRIKQDTTDWPNLYIVGLLHNIGWILLDHIGPVYLAACLNTAKEIDEWTLQYELDFFGVDHAEAGAIMMKKWSLQENICSVIENHHTPDKLPESLQLPAGIIQAASSLNLFHFPLEPGFSSIPGYVKTALQLEDEAELITLKEKYREHIIQAKAMADLLIEGF